MNVTDLIDKFVVFYVVGGDVKYPTMMEVKQVEDIAGRVFLSGSQPQNIMGLYNWLGGVPTHIAWDQVTQFHVFENYKSYKQIVSEDQGGRFFDRFKN